jgi:hypothetical protein
MATVSIHEMTIVSRAIEDSPLRTSRLIRVRRAFGRMRTSLTIGKRQGIPFKSEHRTHYKS